MNKREVHPRWGMGAWGRARAAKLELITRRKQNSSFLAHDNKMDPAVETFIKEHPAFTFNDAKTRVICSITGHELPCNITSLESYISGKKYKQITKDGTCNLAKIAEFQEYLIPSKKGKNTLYCVVTKKEINNIPAHVENHITGRKFQRDLKIYKKNLEAQNNVQASGSSEKQIDEKEKDESETENIPDEEMMEELIEADEHLIDAEFQGGLWIPEGTKISEGMNFQDEEMMVDEESEQGNKINSVGKGKKNKLKRKMKENKKGKVAKDLNQKMKR